MTKSRQPDRFQGIHHWVSNWRPECALGEAQKFLTDYTTCSKITALASRATISVTSSSV